MAAQEGQCPTCGNNIIIPILDRYGRLVDPVTRKIIKQDPHPVHAYAAAGVRAPKIHRKGKVLTIECPRCQAISPITSNNCGSCQLPFTMEGTTATISPQTNGMAMASLVLGILSLPAGCTIVIPVLAVVFGSIALARPTGTSRGKNMAITGIACGLLGLAVFFMLNR
jgi:hypothetical protein